MPNNKKVKDRKRINLTLEMNTFKEVEKLASKRGDSAQDVMREFISQGLCNNYCVENIDLIMDIMRTQLISIIDPAVNRMAALSSKAAVQSATAAYLTAETIAKFVPVERQEEFLDTYEAARKKGVAYVKGKSLEER